MTSRNHQIFNSIINNSKLSDYYLLFVFHLSKNNFPYLRLWLKKFKNLGVISIPYSENKDVSDSISNIATVFHPKLNDIPHTIETICKKNTDKKIILVEIGGYSAEISNKLKNVLLSVEDTNQGHWNFFKNRKKLNFPVISMAESKLKSVENHLIGDSISYSVISLLREYFNQDFIAGKKILVLAYGGIGSAVSHSLKALRAEVMVHDINPIKQVQAFLEGFPVVEKTEAISRADIIIGCSGKQSLSIEELDNIKSGCILISGSSKQIEFPYDYIQKYATKKNSDEIEMINYKNNYFYVAYKGQPINFLHDSSLGDIFELQMSLLHSCIDYGINTNLAPNLYNIPVEYELRIAENYIKKRLTHE